MAARLYMLWEMLKDTGVIFVSINDVELFRLGMLLDEIFGEENRVGTLVWNGSTDNNPTRIATEHEYILCYAKQITQNPTVWYGRQNDIRDLMLEFYDQLRAETADVKEIQRRFREFIRDNKESL